MIVRVELSTMFGCKVCQDTVVISGDGVCYNLVFGTLVGVFSVMWSELLMTSAISGHQCTSARDWSVRSHLR